MRPSPESPTQLPAFRDFADELALMLGGEVIVLRAEDEPSLALRIGAHCVLLLRDHRGTVVLSFPVSGGWRASTRDEWEALRPDVIRALAEYRPTVSMGDVIAQLPTRWEVSFPVDAVPSDAWLFRGARKVALVQNPTSVSVVIWEGGTKHEREIATLEEVDEASLWIEEELARQARLAEAATTQAALREAHRALVPPPDYKRVLAAMRDGQSFPIGGGRSFSTYGMKEGRLVVTQFDEGYTEEVACGEETLRAAISADPDVFRRILEGWAARS